MSRPRWWAAHNLVAHLLLVLCPPTGRWLHRRTGPVEALPADGDVAGWAGVVAFYQEDIASAQRHLATAHRCLAAAQQAAGLVPLSTAPRPAGLRQVGHPPIAAERTGRRSP